MTHALYMPSQPMMRAPQEFVPIVSDELCRLAQQQLNGESAADDCQVGAFVTIHFAP